MKTLLLSAALFFSVLSAAAQEVPILQKELPSEARLFIKDYFKSPFSRAMKEVGDRKISYDVTLEDNTEIEFDDAGRWTEVDGKGKAIPTTFIQRTIVGYVKSNYSNQYIVKIERTDLNYEIELKSGIDLIFDPMGTFVKED